MRSSYQQFDNDQSIDLNNLQNINPDNMTYEVTKLLWLFLLFFIAITATGRKNGKC